MGLGVERWDGDVNSIFCPFFYFVFILRRWEGWSGVGTAVILFVAGGVKRAGTAIASQRLSRPRQQ